MCVQNYDNIMCTFFSEHGSKINIKFYTNLFSVKDITGVSLPSNDKDDDDLRAADPGPDDVEVIFKILCLTACLTCIQIYCDSKLL